LKHYVVDVARSLEADELAKRTKAQQLVKSNLMDQIFQAWFISKSIKIDQRESLGQ
jgi:hypothetical protein